ncbi:MAG TPA: Fic family protein [Allosphingosinicella sp.]|jgi:hypothetical protein|nr:Fic family protein [Allosphingosinicella sp.]
MTAHLLDFPQLPRDRTVAYSGLLAFPRIEPLSPLAVRSRAVELQLARAQPSSAESLDRLASALVASAPDSDLEADSHPGLRDELEPYVQAPIPRPGPCEAAKVRAEFAVYARLAGRHEPFAAMDEKAFVDFLVEVHRRLGAGLNALRDGAVGLRPDSGGNRVLFPHHRLCPALLSSLHGFLRGHLADHPGLGAAVAFAAIVHAHPFNDGNGRTARTIYNLILADGTGTRHFVPIHAIAGRFPGFAIKLKRALHGGDWLSLQSYFADAIRLSRSLQGESREDSESKTPRERRG